MSDDDVVPPADAFELLADETRVRILQELGDAWVDEWPGVCSYSTLMSRVGAEDSSRFNYHLSRLTDRFVVRRENGYKLDFTGLTVYRTLHAGTFTEARHRESFDAGVACHACGAALEARYDRDLFVVACPTCGSRFSESPVPPHAAERGPDALLAAADAFVRNYLRLLVASVCPWCTGKVTRDVRPAETSELDPTPALQYHVRHTCEHCGGRLWEPVGVHALVEPAVVHLLSEAGHSPRQRPYWEFAFAVTDDYTSVRQRDPWQFAIDVPAADHRRTVLLNEQFRVESIT